MVQDHANNNPALRKPMPVLLSIGIIARNEAHNIHHTIASLFQQNVFRELSARGALVEILCMVNGSTDKTAAVVRELFAAASMTHPHRRQFTARAHIIAEAGKPNAVNEFIHTYSAKGARYLVLMDADITFVHKTAIWNLILGLEHNPIGVVTVGKPLKSITAGKTSGVRKRLSIATSRMTQSVPAQITGQLYCIRAATARKIHFPRALTSCDDGFVKNLVCTDFGKHPSQTSRIITVPDAAHNFDAYMPLKHVIMNQKRQMMGQTFLHILMDQFIPNLDPAEHDDLACRIRELESQRPSWLSELMTQHLHKTRYFWRLFPGFLTFRFRRLQSFPILKQAQLFPAALAGFVVTLLAGWLAARALRKGVSQYWPELRTLKNP